MIFVHLPNEVGTDVRRRHEHTEKVGAGGGLELAREFPELGGHLAAEVERIEASAHEFSELRLLGEIRLGLVPFSADETLEAEALLGTNGYEVATRLGLPSAATREEVRRSAIASLERWQRRAENPLAAQEVRDASRILTRTLRNAWVENPTSPPADTSCLSTLHLAFSSTPL